MKIRDDLSIIFKENSCSHYVLKYVKFKGGKADVTEASSLFKGKVQDKNKARKSAQVLIKDGCLTRISGDTHQITAKGLDVILAIGRMNSHSKPDLLRD
jgi:hypothetical protein